MGDSSVGKISLSDFEVLRERLTVDPVKYSKPVRIYCDVDGVLIPFGKRNFDVEKSIEFLEPNFLGDSVLVREGSFVSHQFVVDKVVEWSNRDDVDFVWLTSWRVNAPYVLDDLFGIKSLGFLPWQRKRSDYTHYFKRVAIQEDQENYPSDFVWLDDFANKQQDDFASWEGLPIFSDFAGERDEFGEEVLVHEIDPSQYLSLTTDSSVGLSQKEIMSVDGWLDARRG